MNFSFYAFLVILDMKLLITYEELRVLKSKDIAPVECKFCQKTFYLKVKIIRRSISGKYRETGDFCSRKCCSKHKIKPGQEEVYCLNCNNKVIKSGYSLKKFKTYFCSRSCRTIYHNCHKTTGTKVSKMEKWLHLELPKIYPNIKFMFNDLTTINQELDIYIPQIRLAFELNGIFHYEPIFGLDKLNKTKFNDSKKFQTCISNNIELAIIDISSVKKFTEANGLKYLEIIKSIIDQALIKWGD